MKVKRLGFPTKHVIILMTWHPGSKEEQKTGDATLLQTEGQKAGWGEVVAVFFYLKVYIYIYILLYFLLFQCFLFFLTFFTVHIYHICTIYIYIFTIFLPYTPGISTYISVSKLLGVADPSPCRCLDAIRKNTKATVFTNSLEVCVLGGWGEDNWLQVSFFSFVA